MRDVKTVASEVETTISDFKSHSYISAIEKIGTIASGLSQDIQDCEGASTEAQQLAQQLKTIYEDSSAWTVTFEIGKNVLVNGVDIYNDITGAISAYDSADYYTMGQDIGNGTKKHSLERCLVSQLTELNNSLKVSSTESLVLLR